MGWAANYQLLLTGRQEREERGERGGTDLGFDGLGQVRTGERVNNRGARQIKLIETTSPPLLSSLEINI